jgi:hypothetical protein
VSDPRTSSAAGGFGEGAADLSDLVGAERRDPPGQEELVGQEGVVDGEDAISVHSVRDTQLDLCVPAANVAGDGHDDYIELPLDVVVPRENQCRPALLIRRLIQPNLTASHHGS